MALKSRSLTRERLCIEFASLKHVCPQGVYVAPLPEDPLHWTGILFVRRGPYVGAILRFTIEFAEDHPNGAPTITFAQDVFHPLVAPLTTYSYSSRDRDADTISSGDGGRLPPGSLSLREGFPEWFCEKRADGLSDQSQDSLAGVAPPHVLHVLQYMRLIFSTPELLDDIKLAAAANPSAWHAWQTHRKRAASSRTQSPALRASNASRASDSASDRSLSPRGSVQQPGGARRPGEWNWNGVWEDRVKKVVTASQSEGALYGAEGDDVIKFTKLDKTIADATTQVR